jgi:hypothetical protein
VKISTRKPRLRPSEFLIPSAKRLGHSFFGGSATLILQVKNSLWRRRQKKRGGPARCRVLRAGPTSATPLHPRPHDSNRSNPCARRLFSHLEIIQDAGGLPSRNCCTFLAHALSCRSFLSKKERTGLSRLAQKGLSNLRWRCQFASSFLPSSANCEYSAPRARVEELQQPAPRPTIFRLFTVSRADIGRPLCRAEFLEPTTRDVLRASAAAQIP